jgi:hypothetical protein
VDNITRNADAPVATGASISGRQKHGGFLQTGVEWALAVRCERSEDTHESMWC